MNSQDKTHRYREQISGSQGDNTGVCDESNFQICYIILLTIVTMLYIISP